MSEIKKSTIKTINRILANSVATPAIPPKPKTPAIKAIIKKVTAQFNIEYLMVDFIYLITKCV